MPTVRTTLPRRTDRRHFLGAAGAAVAGGVMLGVAEVHTAGASDGNNFLIGGDNTATNTTLLNGGTTLYVEDGGSMDNATVSVHQTSAEAVALHAEATGSSGGVAVNAFNSSSSGVAVSAANSGTGGRAIRADNLAGGPEAVLATNDVADAIAINAINHAIGGTAVNAVSSEDGTGLYASSQNGRAIYAQAGGSDETLVVTSGMSAAIVADGSTFGVEATASRHSWRGVGVQGEGSTGLVGVGTNTGLDAVGSVVGVRAAASSVNGTAMYLAAQVGHLAPAARAATYTRGQVEMDENGNLWLCTATGTPGTWRKLAGPATAGAFHALTPGRVTDSRPTQGGSGPLDVTGTVTVSVANRMAVGVVPPLADFVPAGATAVTANVTVTNTVGTGYLAVNPGGTTSVAASTINWVGTGLNLANGVTLTLNANRELTVICGGQPGAQANFIIDITGYYR